MAEKTDITKDTRPKTIEQDIARTRKEMAGTVAEIEERVSPAHFRKEAKGKVLDSVKSAASRISSGTRETASRIGDTAKGAGSSILNVVKNYPIPLFMIGVGVTWLMITRSSAAKGETMESAGVREKVSEIADTAQAKAEELSAQTREKGSQLADRARVSAQRLGKAAQESARGAGNKLQEMIEQNPLAVCLAAFGIGALIGFSIPESRKEREMMGSASESLLSRAKETAQRTLQKAQQAAEKAVESAEQELKKTA